MKILPFPFVGIKVAKILGASEALFEFEDEAICSSYEALRSETVVYFGGGFLVLTLPQNFG